MIRFRDPIACTVAPVMAAFASPRRGTAPNRTRVAARSIQLAVAVAGLLSQPVFAQTADQTSAIQPNQASDADQPGPAGQPATSTPAPSAALPETSAGIPAASPPPNPYSRFDKYTLQGSEQPYPPVADSILRDAGGFRSALADLGIGFSFINLTQTTYNLLQNDGDDHGHQSFNGQKFTVPLSLFSPTITYDLGRIGLDGGQLVGAAAIGVNGFQSLNGPDAIRMQNFYWYQPLFKDKIEITLGYYDNQSEFIGLNVGGNLASGTLGPESVIPFETGLSYGVFATPSALVKVNINKQVYAKVAVQRSLPPSSNASQLELHYNPSGFRFNVPNANALVVGEAGYEVQSAPGRDFFWFRAGGLYNFSNYESFPSLLSGGTEHNQAAYALVDAQLTQPNPFLPFRGLYIGGSVNYAPPNVNLYDRYFEGRVYDIGLFSSRPFDLVSFVATYNGYSNSARRVLTPPGGSSYGETQTYIAGYAYRVIPGLYVQPGLGLIVHPLVTPKFPVALDGYLNVAAFF